MTLSFFRHKIASLISSHDQPKVIPMKKIFLLTSLLCFQSVFAYAADHKNIIHVSGAAEMQLPSDVAVIDGALIIKKKHASEASKENARILEKVRTIWSKEGFDPKNIITVNYRLSPKTKYNKIKGRSEPDGFEVNHGLKFKIKDTKRLGEAADLLVRHGITHIHNMRFEAQKSKENYNKLLEMAMKDAEEKAKIIMQSVSGTALTLYNASITPSHRPSPYPQPVMARSMAMDAESAPETVIQTEGQTIRTTVKTEWHFIP